MTPINDPITLYGIIGVLAATVVYLYRKGEQKDKALLDKTEQFANKVMELADEARKQQEFWFEKFEVARRK